MSEPIYVHFGHDKFIPSDICRVTSAVWSKPDRGLWASRIDADWGWIDWCKSNDYFNTDFSKRFYFTLSDDAKILEIHSESDILPYIAKREIDVELHDWRGTCKTDILDRLDLDKLYVRFDGIELFLSENYNMHYGIFNSWDCDSICIWNPDIIEIVSESYADNTKLTNLLVQGKDDEFVDAVIDLI